jgi:hypothetical protein
MTLGSPLPRCGMEWPSLPRTPISPRASRYFNQALIFYHFGSVQNLMLAALDLVSARRMRAYEPAFEQAQTVSELAMLAREIYSEDLGNGYVTVLGEMVAGGVSSTGRRSARPEPSG